MSCVLGGCTTDTPLIIFDNLFKLKCQGHPSDWRWKIYRSPALFRRPGPQVLNSNPSSKSNDSSNPPTSRSDISPRHALSSSRQDSFRDPHQLISETSSDRPSHGPYDVYQDRRDLYSTPTGSSGTGSTSHSADSGVKSSNANTDEVRDRRSTFHFGGLPTTGDIPIERFGASLVPLGDRRLAVVGGMTVEEGGERNGNVFDEFCVCHLAFSFIQVEGSLLTSENV